MKAALRKYAAGKSAALPHQVLRHVIAARYGTSPMAVDGWPADDFLFAVAIDGYLERHATEE